MAQLDRRQQDLRLDVAGKIKQRLLYSARLTGIAGQGVASGLCRGDVISYKILSVIKCRNVLCILNCNTYEIRCDTPVCFELLTFDTQRRLEQKREYVCVFFFNWKTRGLNRSYFTFQVSTQMQAHKLFFLSSKKNIKFQQ